MVTEYNKLKFLMKQRKITMAKLKRNVGLLKTDLEHIENCEPLDSNTLIRLCNYFQCNVFDIIDLKNNDAEIEKCIALT